MKWRARYRDAANREHSRHFDRKVDAQRWLDSVTSSKVAGTYVDPALSRVTVGAFAEQWAHGLGRLKPTTRARYEGILRVQVLPSWATVRLADVSHADVAAWTAALHDRGLAASTVRQAHRVLSLVLALAVRDGRIARNPAVGVPLPPAQKSSKRFLTHGEVARLAEAAGENRLVILTLAYTGLRFGELVALRAGRVDLMRRRLEVRESASEVGRDLHFGTPKTHQERSVPVPRFLVDELAVQLAGKAPDALVFTAPQGGPLRLSNFRRRVFDPAAAAAGLDGLTPHELRHTAASLAVAAGANVKSVQRMLGHASAAMTLDVYSGLFDSDLDAVAERMDAAALADSLRTGGEVVAMPIARAAP